MVDRDRDKRDFPVMQPRDILTPTATLLALSVASIALVVSVLPQNPDIVRNFATIMIGVVILFVATAVSTSLASLLGRESFWRFSIALYIVGWTYLGAVLFILFIGYATGIESFQLPQFDISIGLGIPLLMSIFSLAISIIAVLRFRILVETLYDMIASLRVDRSKVKEETQRVLASEGKDIKMSVIETVIEIEKKLKELAFSAQLIKDKEIRRGGRQIAKVLHKWGIINSDLMGAVDEVWRIRNLIVHGHVVTEKETRTALDLAVTVLVALREIQIEKQK